MPLTSNPDVLRGMSELDDAGVYKLTDDIAIIQTVDFFTPVVDEPYAFGQIAAANALSDVYAMGGRPLTAMNIVCFPSKSLDISVLKDILRGGVDKMYEAEVTLVGGHTIDDPELKYGLSVTGIVHPQNLVSNSNAEVGDKLVLTKPLGTGIISTAIKAGEVAKETLAEITESMSALNKEAAELMIQLGTHACTDITGFGLLGHSCQIAQNSQVCIELNLASIPFFPEAKGFSQKGLCPGGLYRNKDYYSNKVSFANTVPEYMQNILFDAQTSGGLLISLAPKAAELLVSKLRAPSTHSAAIIGEVVAKPEGMIIVR